MAIWRNTFSMIKDHPWYGVGIANYKIHFPKYTRPGDIDLSLISMNLSIKRAHNEYLHVFSELGIVGFLLFMVIIIYSYIMGFRILSVSKDPTTKNFTIAILAVLTGFNVVSLFSFPGKILLSQLLYFLYLGVLTAIYHREVDNRMITLSAKNPLSIMLVSGLAVLFFSTTIFSTYWNYRFMMADHHYLKSNYYYNQQRRLIPAYNESVTMFDYYPYYYKYQLNWAGMNYNRGNYQEAIDSIEKTFIKNDPYRFQLLHTLGISYFRAGDYRRAIPPLEKILEIQPDLKEPGRALKYINASSGNQ